MNVHIGEANIDSSAWSDVSIDGEPSCVSLLLLSLYTRTHASSPSGCPSSSFSPPPFHHQQPQHILQSWHHHTKSPPRSTIWNNSCQQVIQASSYYLLHTCPYATIYVTLYHDYDFYICVLILFLRFIRLSVRSKASQGSRDLALLYLYACVLMRVLILRERCLCMWKERSKASKEVKQLTREKIEKEIFPTAFSD
jgi:hypothetical protein